MMQRQQRLQRSPLVLKASDIARVHTVLSLAAFVTAFALGTLLHFEKIVKNGVAGYPQEWFPSVSATIGDWYPERNIFHILIAVNSGPRFIVVFLQYYLCHSSVSSLPLVVLLSGITRTLCCGGWVYITSNDDHDVHDILMITYIICNIPWMYGVISCTPKHSTKQRRLRTALAAFFWVMIIPMLYYFVEHKVKRVPGAYTRYAFFEWSLIFADILFDSIAELDFEEAKLQIALTMPDQTNPKVASPVTCGNEIPSSTLLNDEKPVDKEILNNADNDAVSNTVETSVPEKTYGTVLNTLQSSGNILPFASDLLLAYFFWSIFTSLIPTLFYFSVWELGFTGAEFALLTILSPCLLEIRQFKTYASTHSGRAVLHFLSFLGLAAFTFPKPSQRLVLVAFANFFLCIGAAVDLSGLRGSYPRQQSILYCLGLIFSSLSKHVNYSNNPVWPMLNSETGGYNKTGLFLAVLSLWEFMSRPSVVFRSQVSKEQSGHEKNSDATKATNQGSHSTNWLLASISLGSLIFSLHLFLTDSSTLIAWTWAGYPIKGPVPHLHGAYTLLAQILGVLLAISDHFETLLKSRVWYAVGALSAFMLYSYHDWLGYMGGLGIAIFLMSIVPQVVQMAESTRHAGKTYFSAAFVALLFYLANVWTVAYAFVPFAGEYLRERTDFVLFTQILALAPAFVLPTPKCSSMQMNVGAAYKFKLYTYASLAIMAILAALVSLAGVPAVAPQPYRPGPRIIRAGIWTVHFGIDNEGRDSQRAMRDLIGDLELDVVGLLETDLHRPIYGNRDLTRLLARDLGYYVDQGPGPNKHTWGATLLSKFPIINSTHHLLPSPRGELAPAISAYLDMWGTEVMVVVSHNGQEEDLLDRELQSKELARIMNEAYPTPVIFIGYVVTEPHTERPSPYKIMVEDGNVHDIDADDHDRWCEYMFYRGLYRTSYLRMSRGKVTDTELQAGQFVVPRFGHSVTDDSEEARYLRIRKEVLGEQHWFPMEYYQTADRDGKNGHFYHVFGTPLYYNIPEGVEV